MMKIDENTFAYTYSKFKNIVESDNNEKLVDFKTNKFIDKHENYKYKILEEAKNQLISNTWKKEEIGKGRILKSVKNSIQTSVNYNFTKNENNLIDWRKKDNFNKLKTNRQNEELFFDFFKSKIKDEVAFEKFEELKFSYQLIAYLFFIKNSQKYLPISQKRFDKIFKSLNIDFKTDHNLSWENYNEYNEVIKSFKNYLKERFVDITLLDAHSFLWIYGFQFNEEDKVVGANKKQSKVPELKKIEKEKPNENQKTELEIYQLKERKQVETSTNTPNSKKGEPSDDNEKNKIDYQKLHKRQMELGDLAEKIVLENEKKFLMKDHPELAKKTHSVAHNPMFGYDILSYETDGRKKQIEVKAISSYKNKKSFIISRNELIKSKTNSNYYVYCVGDVESENPKILRVKNPDFDNEKIFKVESINFKITFE